MASNVELWHFFDISLDKMLKKVEKLLVIWDAVVEKYLATYFSGLYLFQHIKTWIIEMLWE